MVVDVDVKSLGGFVTELKKLINDYDELQLNLFNQLKLSCSDWHDGNSALFEEKLKDEKNASTKFLNALVKDKDIFEYAYKEYKTIGEKVHFNLAKRNSVLAAIDDAINKTTYVLNEFYCVNRSWYYSELNQINAEQRNFESIKSGLKTMKQSVNDLCNKVVLIENNVSSLLAKMEEIKTAKFTFAFEAIQKATHNVLEKNKVLKDIENIKLYASEEYSKVNGIYNTFTSCFTKYKGNSNTNFSRKLIAQKGNLNTLRDNRMGYVSVLNKAIQIYDDTATNFVTSAKKQGEKTK